MAEARGDQHTPGSLVHVSQQILGGCRQHPTPDLCCQRRAPLQRQLVQRDVVITEPQGRLQPLGPGIPALSRQPKQEVDGGSARKEPPRCFHSLPCLCRRVLPAQHPQLGVIQRLRREHGASGLTGGCGGCGGGSPSHLDADGDAVDPSCPEAGKVRGAGGAGVGLQRDLSSRRKVGSTRHSLQHRRDSAGAGQAGRAPAEEDGGDAVGQRWQTSGGHGRARHAPGAHLAPTCAPG